MDKNQAKHTFNSYISFRTQAKEELAEIEKITNSQVWHQKVNSSFEKHSRNLLNAQGLLNSYNLNGEVNMNDFQDYNKKNQQDINQDLDNFNQGLNDYVENQKDNSQQQQLLFEIMQLEQNSTKNQAELDSKKQQLKELGTKSKELIKPLPLDTQITILQKEIQVLTSKSTKTKAEEVLLADKRKELNELLSKKNNLSTTNAKPTDKTALYVGLGVIGVVLIGLVLILKYKKQYKNMVNNAQEYIKQKYPNKEERKNITKLNITGKKLRGELDLSDFINLKELCCYDNELTKIKPSDSSDLKEIELLIKDRAGVYTMPGVSWQLIEVEILPIDLNDNLIVIINEVNVNKKVHERKKEIVEQLKKSIQQREELIEVEEKIKEQTQLLQKVGIYPRNILLIGNTGSGKSTLANVISGTNNFKESAGSVSETRNKQIEEFKTEDGVRYRVIDTIGFGDTKLTNKEVTKKIAKTAQSIKDGLNQILFVTKSRFTKEDRKLYDFLREVVFDNDITKHITIVRTDFINFQTGEFCKNNTRVMIEESKELSDLIKSCDKRIVYVDNPPIDISGKEVEKKINDNKRIREVSRKRLLEHLANCQEIYNPQNLKKLTSKNSKLQEKITELEGRLKNEGENQELLKKEIDSLQEKINKSTLEHIEESGGGK
ncbi:15962_t:CDS:2 [Funneliformis geosporum]|uniref:15962_t:CDS:1 n=1 Tax=Funneliformis geosporum TaxID=1117311 RepID=A0A9W4WX96_9GLOM|nr:15962_t:CDS:2 [Funneliformis geosporum]